MIVDPHERSLRKAARLIGIGVARRRDRSTGQFGYMLYDMRSSSIIAGADPVPYSLSLDEVEQFFKKGREVCGVAGELSGQN